MKPVEQRELAVYDDAGDPVKHGDCMRAAVASVFELDLLDVPHFAAEDSWWNDWMEWLAERNLRIGTAFYSVDEEDPTRLNGWPGDLYWLAVVKSPRVRARCSSCKGACCDYCDGSGRVPGTHMIVMHANEVAWDPHPARADGHLGFVAGYDFRVIDPARVAKEA